MKLHRLLNTAALLAATLPAYSAQSAPRPAALTGTADTGCIWTSYDDIDAIQTDMGGNLQVLLQFETTGVYYRYGGKASAVPQTTNLMHELFMRGAAVSLCADANNVFTQIFINN